MRCVGQSKRVSLLSTWRAVAEMSHWTRGVAQLRRCVPEIFAPGSCLYIGASRDKFAHGAAEMIRAGRQITILEIWEPNLEFYRGRKGIVRVIGGDVRRIAEMGLPAFDVAIWWHGPEHIRRNELAATLAGLEAVATLVVLGCPFGHTQQREEEMRGNPYQKHLSGFLPRDFVDLGYSTDTFGQEGAWNACNLLAWK